MDAYRAPRRRLLGFALAAVVAIAVAACGNTSSSVSNAADTSSPSTNTGRSQTASTPGLASLSQIVPAPTIPPLPKKPPTGIKVDFLTCNIPGCAQIFASNDAAIKALGWTSKTFTYNLAAGPNAENVAFAQVIQDKPNYLIWIDGFPYSTIAKGMSAVAAAHIGSIASGGSTLAPGLLNCVSCAAEYGPRGVGATVMKVAQANTKNPSVAMIFEPGLVGPSAQLSGLQSQAKAGGGTVSSIPISGSNTQQQNVQAVVSYLQSHPQTQYVATPIDAWFEGLPTALQQAGLANKVKLIAGLMTLPSDVGLIKSGQLYAGIAEESQMSTWAAIDTAARDAEHQPIPKSLLDPVGWQEVVTKANVNSLPTTLQAPNYEQPFLTAWHVG